MNSRYLLIQAKHCNNKAMYYLKLYKIIGHKQVIHTVYQIQKWYKIVPLYIIAFPSVFYKKYSRNYQIVKRKILEYSIQQEGKDTKLLIWYKKVLYKLIAKTDYYHKIANGLLSN